MIEMHITYDETTGFVNVDGPTNNKGLCYLMLGCARDAVKDHVDNAQRVMGAGLPSNGLGGVVRRSKGKRR